MMLVASIAMVNAQEVIDNQKLLEWIADEDISENDIKLELSNPGNTFQINWSMDFSKELTQKGASDDLKQFIMQAAVNPVTAKSNQQSEEKHWGLYYKDKDNNNQLTMIPINSFQVEKKTLGNYLRKAADVVTNIGIFQVYTGDYKGLYTMIEGMKIANMASTLGDPKFKTEKLILEEDHARVGFYNSNPVLRFYFPEQTDNSDLDVWIRNLIGSVKNPNDFLCVRLTPKKDKRTFPKGLKMSDLVNITLSSNKDNIIKFDYKQVGDDVYDITFPEGLEIGEYCLYYKNYENTKLSNHLIAFDFSVK